MVRRASGRDDPASTGRTPGDDRADGGRPGAADPGHATAPPSAGADPGAALQAALGVALAAVGDRWTGRVVAALLDGPARFGDLQERVDGIAPNILADRVRRLERTGLAVARAYQERPVRMEYALTEHGAALADALRLLAAWGGRADVAAPTHDACGTALRVRWWCPTCARDVDATAADPALTWL